MCPGLDSWQLISHHTGKMPLDPNAAWRRNTHMEFIMYVVNRNHCRCLFSSPDNCSAVWSKCNRTAQIWRSKLVSQDSKTCSYSGLMWKRLALLCMWWLMLVLLCWSCFYNVVFCFLNITKMIYMWFVFRRFKCWTLSCWCSCADVVVLMWCPCVDVVVLMLLCWCDVLVLMFFFMLFFYFLFIHV